MASAEPTRLQVRMLHDVDGTMIATDHRGRAILNDALVQFALEVQRRLQAAGAEVLHHLFTSRWMKVTIAYAFTDFIRSDRSGDAESLSLLGNIVAAAQARGLAFHPEIPVIQFWDSIEHIPLGDAYRRYHKPFEGRLVDKQQKFFKDLYSWLKEKKYEGNALGAIDSVIRAYEMVQYHAGSHTLMMQEVYQANTRDDHYTGYFVPGNTQKKTGMLAKLFAATDTHNTRFIWVDDREELYQQALAEKKILVKGEPLASIVKRCVIFIHHNIPDIPEPPKAAQEYWAHLIRETAANPAHECLHRHLITHPVPEAASAAGAMGMAFTTEAALAMTSKATDSEEHLKLV